MVAPRMAISYTLGMCSTFLLQNVSPCPRNNSCSLPPLTFLPPTVCFDGFFMWALLSEFGIKAWNHYSPMHLSTSFRSRMLGKVGDCPVAEAKFEEYVSLPIHPRLTDEAVAYMIDAIKQLSQRPHLPRLCPTPLLNALTSLYVQKVTMHTSDSPAENDWEHFKSEVLTSHTLFSTSAPIIASRAPGRLDLMGIQFSPLVFLSSPHLVA
jgi:hypothetical protein